MLKYALIAAALMFPGVAHAKTWYVASQGNHCILSPTSPQGDINAYLDVKGKILSATVKKFASGESMVVLSDDDAGLGFVLFTSMQDCKDYVKLEIESGDVTDPDLLK